ncbi:DUF4231 domain-containing protein [Catenulispora rubra]|uniref:DUF4231 domain-containing protein n=1 Tax=Catenulispora rubra TaxID=280293 RepID=UPI0018926E58|nr:DUF4231 domain-containing protein [Catenulispora rubra]
MAQQPSTKRLVELLRSEISHLENEYEQKLAQASVALVVERAERTRVENAYKELSESMTAEDEESTTPLEALRGYRKALWDEIDHFTQKANASRRYSNILQWTIIVGSVLAAALTTAGAASRSAQDARVIAAITSGVVSVAASAAGFFKYRERGFNEQMTADAIEKHRQAAELSIGEYGSDMSEEERLRLLATNVEIIKDDQRKRELQLEQKSEERGATQGSTGA